LQSLREWRAGISPPVFFSAAAFNLTLIAYAGLWTENAGRTFSALLSFIAETFGWYYVLTTAGIVAFVFWLLLSPYGNLRLGKPDEVPDFNRLTWLAMLFAACATHVIVSNIR
jgi:choline/glycine/proline betaine transport protein